MKTCTKCKENKEDILFSVSQAWCKKCDNEYHKLHYTQNKAYYYEKSKRQRLKLQNHANSIKSSSGCLRCNEKDIACLDFHHLGSKEDNIANIINKGRSLESLQKEIEKCIILCSNCHRKEHYYN